MSRVGTLMPPEDQEQQRELESELSAVLIRATQAGVGMTIQLQALIALSSFGLAHLFGTDEEAIEHMAKKALPLSMARARKRLKQ